MSRLYLRSSVAARQPRAKGDGLEKRLLLDAEAGDARAQCNLGILYGNGLDDNGYAVEGDRPQAIKWLLAAAEQGLPRAQIELAEMTRMRLMHRAATPPPAGGSWWRHGAWAGSICSERNRAISASWRI
jgi:TPR repeat protein